MVDDVLTISEAAKRTGVRPSTLRYYESVGLLAEVERIGGKRHYRPEDGSACG